MFGEYVKYQLQEHLAQVAIAQVAIDCMRMYEEHAQA